MKTRNFKFFSIAVALLSLITVTGCEEQSELENLDNMELSATEAENMVNDSIQNINDMLKYMREEEKLAHDVYVTLYDQWDAKVFENISKSETKHTDAIKGLLDYYNIEDPALTGIGAFNNEELQKLYDDLTAQGNASLIEALKVGATIEEVDIIDLDTAMNNCDVDTILTVYGNLRKGSTHHLKAFVYNLSKQGVDYAPQFLTQEEYDEIINSTDSISGNGDGECKDSTNVGTITEEEANGLLWMREEEKLAHDVYVNMYQLWGVKTFDNISKAETKHTESVLSLLNIYGLEDPALPGIGDFSNADLQKLYNDLMAKGKLSLIDGLTVGAIIEEVDIIDLEERMDETENATILKVYSSLKKGSENHLKAYVYQLKTRGVDYKPQYLSQEEFDEIINN